MYARHRGTLRMSFTNDDAQFLVDLKKKLVSSTLRIPAAGEVKIYSATDLIEVREFIFRMRMANGNNIVRHKATYNLFYEGYQILRLDTYGTGVHTNPDGTIIPAHTPYIHIYDESYGDRCAFYIKNSDFSNPVNLIQTLLDFLAYANVVDVEKLMIMEQGGLEFG